MIRQLIIISSVQAGDSVEHAKHYVSARAIVTGESYKLMPSPAVISPLHLSQAQLPPRVHTAGQELNNVFSAT